MQWIIWPMPVGWLHLKSIANWFPSETIDHSIVQKSYQCSGLRIFGNCKICVILSPTRIQSWLWKFCQSVQDCPSQQVARVFSSDVFPFSIKKNVICWSVNAVLGFVVHFFLQACPIECVQALPRTLTSWQEGGKFSVKRGGWAFEANPR